jgi:hypothetical protein
MQAVYSCYNQPFKLATSYMFFYNTSTIAFFLVMANQKALEMLPIIMAKPLEHNK